MNLTPFRSLRGKGEPNTPLLVGEGQGLRSNTPLLAGEGHGVRSNTLLLAGEGAEVRLSILPLRKRETG